MSKLPEKSKTPCSTICSAIVLFVSILIGALFVILHWRLPLPAHLLGHPVLVLPTLLDRATQNGLMALATGLGEFGSVAVAENAYQMRHEDIGEGLDHPAGADGLCSHAFLVPTRDRKRCILPGRVDVGRHYVMTGGVEGRKEQHSDLVSRAQSFIRYLFSPGDIPITRDLFASAPFLSAAKGVCPQGDAAVLDAFQASIIIQVPGQTVPAHIDGVWFHGADRFHVPQWLLAVMAYSGLFQDRFVHQVQLVAYFAPPGVAARRGGDFTHWAQGAGAPETMPCTPGSGTAMDGSKIVHAAAVFEPTASAPLLNKDQVHALRYMPAAAEGAGDGVWELHSGNTTRGLRWSPEELRYSVVYRARCFSSEEERDNFNRAQRAGEGLLDLDKDILGPLKDEVVRRGAGASRVALDALPRLELALKLLDVFIVYPQPAVAVPLNYCALALKYPKAQWLVDMVCPKRALA